MNIENFGSQYAVRVDSVGVRVSPDQAEHINKLINETVAIHLAGLAAEDSKDFKIDVLENKLKEVMISNAYNNINISIKPLDEAQEEMDNQSDPMKILEMIFGLIINNSGASPHDITQPIRTELIDSIGNTLNNYAAFNSRIAGNHRCIVQTMTDIGHILPASVCRMELLRITEDNNPNLNQMIKMLHRSFMMSLFNHVLNPDPRDILNKYIDRETLLSDFHEAVQGKDKANARAEQIHREYHTLAYATKEMEESGVH